MKVNLYVVYDKVLNSCSNISYAPTDLEAFSATKFYIDSKIKENSSYSSDDFELVCVGVFDKSTGLIEPDYRVVTNEFISDFKAKVTKEREDFIRFVNEKFKK